VPCTKGEQLEASHGNLGDLVSQGSTRRLPDGLAGLLDGLIIKFSKDLKGRDHLVILERLSSALIKHEDALKHGGRGTANSRLDQVLDRPHIHLFIEVEVGQVILANLDGEAAVFVVVVVRDSQVIRVIPAVAPSLAPGLKDLIVRAGHHSLKRIALASWSSSFSHSGSSRGLMIDDYRINKSIESVEVSRSLRGRYCRLSGITAVGREAGQSRWV